MAFTAMDSGWFLPLPAPGWVGPDYRPSLTDSALQLFARIEQNPNDEHAVEALAAHFASAGDQPSLANLMEGWGKQLVRSDRPAEGAAAYVRAADAVLAGTGDYKRAAHLLKRAVAYAPSHERALRELHALLATTGQHIEARRWLEFVAEALKTGARPSRYRARVCYRLARLLERELKDPEAALARYAESLREDNGYEPARSALLRLQAPAPVGALVTQGVTQGDSPVAESARCPSDPPPRQEPPRTEPAHARQTAKAAAAHAGAAAAAARAVVDSRLRLPAAKVVSARAIVDMTEGPLLEVDLGSSTDSNFYTGFTEDPRRAGVFVATYQQLRVGSRLRLQLTFPGGVAAPAAGRVRFVHDGLLDDTPPGVGVQLQALTAEGCTLIERFMQERTPIFYSD